MTLRRFTIVAILAVCLGAPIAEMFDQWDHTYQDGNDTETNVAVAALCVGIALSAAGAIVARVRSLSSQSGAYRFVCRVSYVSRSVLCLPVLTSSPPTPLRV